MGTVRLFQLSRSKHVPRQLVSARRLFVRGSCWMIGRLSVHLGSSTVVHEYTASHPAWGVDHDVVDSLIFHVSLLFWLTPKTRNKFTSSVEHECNAAETYLNLTVRWIMRKDTCYRSMVTILIRKVVRQVYATIQVLPLPSITCTNAILPCSKQPKLSKSVCGGGGACKG